MSLSTEGRSGTAAHGPPTVSQRRYRRSRVGLIDLFLFASLAVLSWTVLGVGGSLLLVGVGTITVVLQQRSSISSPLVALAGAIALEAGFLFGMSVLTHALLPNGSFDLTAPILLALPLVGAFLAWFLVLRGREPQWDGAPQSIAGQYRFMAGAFVAVLAFQAQLILRHGYYAVGWTMSGDASNHLYVTRSIIAANGVSLEQLRAYPPAVNLIVAVVSSAGGRTGLDPRALLLHDLHAMAAVYLLMFASIFCMFAICLVQALKPVSAGSYALGPTTYVLMTLCGLVAFSRPLLGVALVSGFLSAVGGLLFTLITLALTMRVLTTARADALLLASVSALVAFLCWVPLGLALVGPLVVATVYLARRRKIPLVPRWHTWPESWLLLPPLAALAVIGIAAGVSVRTLIKALETGGGVHPIPTGSLIVLTALSVVLVVLLGRAGLRRALLAPVVLGIWSLVLLEWMLHLPGVHGAWTYYAMKFMWLGALALAWVPVAIVATAVEWGAAHRRAGIIGPVLAVSISLGLLAFYAGIPSDVPSSQDYLSRGGALSVRSVVPLMFDAYGVRASSGPVVYWWPPIESIFLNFWSSQIYVSEPASHRSARIPFAPDFPISASAYRFWRWANYDYELDTAVSVHYGLCQLLAYQRGVVVLTPEAGLAKSVQETCPDPGRVSRYVYFARH